MPEEMLENPMDARLAVVQVRSDRNGPRLHVVLEFDSPGRQRQAVIRWVRGTAGWRAIVMTVHDGRGWRSRVSTRMVSRCTAIANTLLGGVDPGNPITVALLDAGVEPRRAQALADAVDQGAAVTGGPVRDTPPGSWTER